MIIQGGTIVTGDGATLIQDGYILIKDQTIIEVGQGCGPSEEKEEVIEASGKLIIPGIINTHAHACAPGPHTPVGMAPLPLEKVKAEMSRHLMGGETTVLHLCGFCLQQEVDLIKDHPLGVRVGTCHLPSCVQAAQLVDGSGLSEAHYNCSVEQRLAEGAVAIGEIGAGHTLGGGAQDYLLIPRAIQRATGIWLRPNQARELKWAVLGKNLQREAFDPQQTAYCLDSFGLGAKLTASEVRELICNSVLPPLFKALRGFEEAAAVSSRTGRPAILHNCPFSISEIARLAQKYPKSRLIAAHSNQADFSTEEAIDWCRRLRDLGVIVDVSTWDCPGKALQADPEKFKTMLREGVVDTVSTDFGGGEWEPILKGLAMAVKDGAIDVAAAVALATGNVARLLPEVADGRGLLHPGKVADLVMVMKEDIGEVREVIIGGKFVLRDGKLLQADYKPN